MGWTMQTVSYTHKVTSQVISVQAANAHYALPLFAAKMRKQVENRLALAGKEITKQSVTADKSGNWIESVAGKSTGRTILVMTHSRKVDMRRMHNDAAARADSCGARMINGVLSITD